MKCARWGWSPAGVMGIKLQSGDELAGMEALPQPGEVFMVASDGSAKRVEVDQFPRQGRYGQGVQAWKLPPKVRIAGMLVGEESSKATLFFSKTAPKLARLDVAPLQGRSGAWQEHPRSARRRRRCSLLSAPWEPMRPGGSQIKPEPESAPPPKRRRPSHPTSAAAGKLSKKWSSSPWRSTPKRVLPGLLHLPRRPKPRKPACPDRGEDRQNCYDREQACQSCQNHSRSDKDGEIHRSSREIRRGGK